MDRFIKVYSGFIKDIEREVNEYAREKHLIIVSSSMAINQGEVFITVIYEKPCTDVKKEDGKQ